ncbi:helix-turn-helix transcriptional regulator [Micromonospora sp. NPDC048063]|uniref:helix-turn-helix transcriptional regulator n=1 Tax=Micromonospora sp. NPDC048063 TaxID=3364256 RepID=UPI003721B87C
MNATWRGWVGLAPGRIYYRGEIGAAGTHSHHAVQLLVARDTVLVLRGADGIDHSCRAALIPANTAHAVVEGAADGLLALIDPVSSLGRLLDRGESGSASAARWRLDPHPPPPAGDVSSAEAIDAVIRSVVRGEIPTARPRHAAVAAAVDLVPTLLPGRIGLGEVARAVHLSQSRLSHLFRQELGLPFRAYVRWERLRTALLLLSSGGSLTQAAHEAGFADSSHLTRVFRSMFGLAPSELLRGVRWEGQQVRPSPGRGAGESWMS